MSFENSAQDSDSRWQGPEGWLQDVLDIAGQVAQVVGPLVPVVLGALSPSGQPQPFRSTGPVNWYVHNHDGQHQVFVENTGPSEVAISFTGYNQQARKGDSELVTLAPAGPAAPDLARRDITGVIRDFMNEQQPNPYIAMVTANRDRTGISLLNTRLISAVLADLLVDRELPIPGGTVKLQRSQGGQGYELVINSAAPLANLQFTIVIHGQAISGTATPSATSAPSKPLIVPIPNAFSFELADSLRLYYELPLSVYEQVGRSLRARRPASALVSA